MLTGTHRTLALIYDSPHMEDGHHALLRPLLPNFDPKVTTTAAATDHDDTIKAISSNSKIILRLLFVTAVGILSVWANHEASKGFEVLIKNEVAATASGRRFELLYVSNDKASRLVFKASRFVETFLYSSNNSSRLIKKRVDRITLRLADRNLTDPVTVESSKEYEFVINLSLSTMEAANVDRAMSRAVQKGMARVWIYDHKAPKSLVDGIAEYISGLAESGRLSYSDGLSRHGCWKDENSKAVASFLNYCEEHKKGFIQRLNQAMRGSWNDRTVDDALGMPAQHLCASYMKLPKNVKYLSSKLPSHMHS